jgi:hypothetical protein
MTTFNIVILCAIVSAFVLFGSVLAWADFYSRRGRTTREALPAPSEADPSPGSVEWRKAA